MAKWLGRWICSPEVPSSIPLPVTRWICVWWSQIQLLHTLLGFLTILLWRLRVLDLKSGGPWFKSSTLLLFVLGSPKFICVNSQLVSLPPVGILNSLYSI